MLLCVVAIPGLGEEAAPPAAAAAAAERTLVTYDDFV